MTCSKSTMLLLRVNNKHCRQFYEWAAPLSLNNPVSSYRFLLYYLSKTIHCPGVSSGYLSLKANLKM